MIRRSSKIHPITTINDCCLKFTHKFTSKVTENRIEYYIVTDRLGNNYNLFEEINETTGYYKISCDCKDNEDEKCIHIKMKNSMKNS